MTNFWEDLPGEKKKKVCSLGKVFTETQTDYDNTPKRAIREFPDGPVVG